MWMGDEKASMVKWVRKKINYGGMIENPVTFNQNTLFSDMQNFIASHKYTFTSFPILDDESRFVGLMTRDEMEFAEHRNPPLLGYLLISSSLPFSFYVCAAMYIYRECMCECTYIESVCAAMYIYRECMCECTEVFCEYI